MQSDPVNGTVAYLGDTELLVPAGSTVVSGQRTYTVLGHAVAVRTATTGVTGSVMTWLDTDPQGTAEISENPTTGATTTRLFDAFGNPRGTPVTWASNDGFLNQPTDSLTGLDDLGARVYRPTLGRFLSEDSVFDASDPQQDDGYSYSRNNPATAADPSGLHAVDDNGETDPYWAAVQRQNVQHGCSDCGSNGGDNYTGGDTGGYYGGYASPSDVPPDQASSTAVQHAATPNPVFQPNALSKAGGGLAIINARINKLMRLSNTVDADSTAGWASPAAAQLAPRSCGMSCHLSSLATLIGDSGSLALTATVHLFNALRAPQNAAKQLGVSIGYCGNAGAGAGFGGSGEVCQWQTPSGQTGTTFTYGYGPSGPAGFGAGGTIAFSNATQVGDLGGAFSARGGSIDTPIGGGQGTLSTGNSPINGRHIWVANLGASWGEGVLLQQLTTITTVKDVQN